MKVLFLEDDPTIQHLIKTLLEIEGFELKSFRDIHATKIYQVIQEENPDVILMDIHLGKINGLDLLKHIRLNPEFQKVKIIMTSGMDLRIESMEAGADFFLMKPYMPDDLVKIIRTQEKK
jgi:two-component system, OmpR family, response regulator CpxR